MDVIEFEVTPSFDDYLSASRTVLLKNWFWGAALRYVGIVGGMVAAFLIISDLSEGVFTVIALLIALGAGVIGGCIALAICLGICLLRIPGTARKAYDRLGTVSETTRYQLDREGFRANAPSGSNNLAWGRLLDFIDAKDALVVRRTKTLIYIWPKRQLTAPQIQTITQTLTANGLNEK